MAAKLLHELFEQSVKHYSEAIAITTPCEKITYKQLETISNYYAAKLIDYSLQPNQLVAVIMEKGWEQVVAVLSILKVGAAYLPIDPNEPKERLQHLLSVCDVNVVLTQKKYTCLLQSCADRNIIIIEHQTEISLLQLDLNKYKVKETDLAYVIFTSGSTGLPKGVMITHQSAINTINDINERFTVSSNDKVLAISDLTFDLSVYDIFGTLAVGATIVMVAAADSKDPTRWSSIIFSKGVTIWNSVPVLMEMFVEFLKNRCSIPRHALRLVMMSGDWIPLNLPDKIRALLGDIELISLGGATEASIWSILFPIKTIDPNWKSIPYGKPMKNQAFYVLDQDLNQVTGDCKGELFIGGIGVANGYWCDDKRTAAQFISHPVYGRLYKTGDLGRYLADGNIEFLGRVDLQVKISGYRVEISAIEKYLLDFPHIKQAIVVPTKDHRHQKLAAYLTFNLDSINSDHNIFDNLQDKQVEHWQKIYNDLSQNIIPLEYQDPTFNTTGWNSSYLNTPIPKIQMQEWVNNTVKRILALKANNILEIGSGMGLLLFQLAREVQSYHAVDFSTKSLQYLEQHLQQLHIKNVTLFQYEAKDIDKLTHSYDTIILNSIVQYFPSVDYLLNVLDICISKVKAGGYVFIGDLRSLAHLKIFHTSVLFNSNYRNLSFTDWLTTVQSTLDEEDELIIDSELFYKLKELNKRVSYVEVLLKEGKFNNEMNNFRYDVILHIEHPIEKAQLCQLTWQDWKKSNYTVDKIHSILTNERPKILAIKNIPNRRIAGFNTIMHAELDNVDDWFSVGKSLLKSLCSKAVDPDIFFEQARNHRYDALIKWSEDGYLDCFDVIFKKKFFAAKFLQFTPEKSGEYKPIKYYANLPILLRLQRKLIEDIKYFLKTKLPYYMIPSYFMVLKEFPLSSNGKVDRKSIPKLLNVLNKESYTEPRTDLELKLANIWKDILGINKVGIHDTFYDLGGTSLLTIQLIMDIEQTFGIQLSTSEIAEITPTIENLSKLLEEHLHKMPIQKLI